MDEGMKRSFINQISELLSPNSNIKPLEVKNEP